MFERFSTRARASVVGAQQEAAELGHPVIGTEHLLLAVLDRPDSTGGRVLQALGLDRTAARRAVAALVPPTDRTLDEAALASIGIDLAEVRRRVEESFGPGALDQRSHRGGHRRFGPRAKKVLELSLREALDRKAGHIGTEHLVLAILREGGGLAARVLAEAGIQRPAVEAALAESGRADTTG